MHDVIVIGGGFAGVTAAREVALAGRAGAAAGGEGPARRAHLDGRLARHSRSSTAAAGCTGTSRTRGRRSRAAGCEVELSRGAEAAAWYVGGERRERHRRRARRDRRARLEPVRRGRRGRRCPNPHDRRSTVDRLARFDRLTIAERIDELELDDEERDVLWAELESLAHGPLDDAGAVSVLRWHALSGYSLALTQYTGGRVTLAGRHRSAAQAIAGGARVRDAPVDAGRGGARRRPTASRSRPRRARRSRRARWSWRCR